jgi:outer membrane protein assembly factor BamB
MVDRYGVVLEDRRLSIGSHDDHIYALDIASGAFRWSVNLEKLPVDKDRKIYVPGVSKATRR